MPLPPRPRLLHRRHPVASTIVADIHPVTVVRYTEESADRYTERALRKAATGQLVEVQLDSEKAVRDSMTKAMESDCLALLRPGYRIWFTKP